MLIGSVVASGCVGLDPVLNDDCDAAADRCSDQLAYEECVDDSFTTLDSNPEYADKLDDCLENSACAAIEACITPGE